MVEQREARALADREGRADQQQVVAGREFGVQPGVEPGRRAGQDGRAGRRGEHRQVGEPARARPAPGSANRRASSAWCSPSTDTANRPPSRTAAASGLCREMATPISSGSSERVLNEETVFA
nr:hypothetical protein [Kitasatospora cheerisanensis]